MTFAAAYRLTILNMGENFLWRCKKVMHFLSHCVKINMQVLFYLCAHLCIYKEVVLACPKFPTMIS
jgi:hypothetical protein